MIEETNDENSEIKRIYEIGFLVMPTVQEAELPSAVSAIKALIEGKGGEIISDEFPYMRKLAYAMEKEIDGKRQSFSTAYFGWVKFEIDTESAVSISKDLSTSPDILRSLTIKTVRESTYTPKSHEVAEERSEEVNEEEAVDAPLEEAPSEEQIDKSIEELVVE